MRRRTFLCLAGALAAIGMAGPRLRAAAQSARAFWWSPKPLTPQRPVVLEWRYLAARLTLDGQELGIVVSIASYNEVPNPFAPAQPLQQRRTELLVARTIPATTVHSSSVFSRPGEPPNYADGVYRFESPEASATWSLAPDGSYRLELVSPDLTLAGLTLRPLTPFVAENGDGEISVARFGAAFVLSDYYNDWVAVERNGTVIGYGRLDMQTLRPTAVARPTGFSHHWFALSGRVAGDEFYLSAYQLVSEQTFWYCTLGRRSPGGSWRLESFSWEDAAIQQPLAVQILAWQPQLTQDGTPVTPARRTGQRWRVTLGRSTPGDVLDLDIPVPPGQFLKGARLQGIIAGEAMQEALGFEAFGRVNGVTIADPRVVVAESTFSEPGEPLPPLAPPRYPPAPPPSTSVYLPLLRR